MFLPEICNHRCKVSARKLQPSKHRITHSSGYSKVMDVSKDLCISEKKRNKDCLRDAHWPSVQYLKKQKENEGANLIQNMCRCHLTTK